MILDAYGGEFVNRMSTDRSAEPESFADWLCRAMDKRGLSVRGLAAKAGISATTVQRYRVGTYDPALMGEDTLIRLAAALDVSERTLRRAVGRPDNLGPWTPPDEAAYLTPAQRRLVSALIKEMVEGR